jgi:HEAT repeat protein
VESYVGRDSAKTWGVKVLIRLVSDGSIDDSGVTGSPPGQYPEGDRDDIMQSPINSICWDLGFMKEKESVPALISVLKRKPKIGGAAFALAEIGDPRGIPVLLTILKDRSGYEHREVTALGKLKAKEAVPELIAHLGHPETTFSGLDILETTAILEALLEIGDKRAIPPIEQYLNGPFPDRSKAAARRVLTQLKSPDPVKTLLVLLEKEAYEPERSDIISALTKYKDTRVVKELANIASTSDSAFMRRQAIFGLAMIGDQQSLLALTSLLDLAFPKDLKAKWGWKSPPDFQTYFPETVAMCLRGSTNQDFGKDRIKWEKWIMANTVQAAPPDAR